MRSLDNGFLIGNPVNTYIQEAANHSTHDKPIGKANCMKSKGMKDRSVCISSNKLINNKCIIHHCVDFTNAKKYEKERGCSSFSDTSLKKIADITLHYLK